MIRKLFTSVTRVSILQLLIFSGKSYHLREISRNIKKSPIYVSKEIANLKNLGLINEAKTGKMRIFKVNKNSPIYTEIKNILLKTDFIGELIKENLNGQKIKFAFIFGSFSRGEELEGSDIDLFVIGDAKENSILEIIQKLEKKVGREINLICWDEETFKNKMRGNNHLLMDIFQHQIIMLIGDEDELRKFR
ncbi:MAG: hypothetical protein COY38_03535 [Candidatus Aenigmarchaeota archaeon CG_4_10_14_0_8_um_filter_37_24]|nr:hypothetical protein [Candidatus Aenigmarchaeota archaeon]OIN87311.1 MAG: hypothetical protein AUJ50_02880 [Candidatus Aenigmarchaeota archaeon CG1_02_38_14]PIV69484.1 MAG: hypothetical protein COS07_00595 [Candidatus Aenigmarchaeota archaeon CG01_land_8_20_14_3_00_37_9]PIY35196.1 MAG: hypothetical protein COZ04_04150 [Candidatus Aenigmarchaeota archaeon CG_4_10_14_3_um_filter_37_21]PIZ34809.1 MAG: hypothetical protein COY38_03535 [Candidatus Aenigmarchaeota archaeon CG_4_10_14_0_8_um_filter